MMALVAGCLNMMGQGVQEDSTRLRPTFGVDLTSELQTDFRKTRMQNLLELSAEIPLSRKLTMHVQSLSTRATNDEWVYYDMQGYSDIDCYEDIDFALAVVGLEWRINDKNTLFAGIRRTDEDYFCSDNLGVFTNSSAGLFPSLSWNYIINTYPEAAMGLHYAYDSERWKLQASLYNGVANHDLKGRNNVFRVCPKSDGVLAMGQVEYRWKGSSYYLGASMHTMKDMPYTVWTYAEQKVWRNVTLLALYGHSFGERRLCKDFVGGGATLKLRRWELGILSDYMTVLDYGEWLTEVVCRWHLTNWLTIKPALHIIKEDDENTKLIGLMRLEVGF